MTLWPYTLPIVAWSLWSARRLYLFTDPWRVTVALSGLCLSTIGSWFVAVALGHLTGFGLMSLSCVALFIGLPIMLLAMGPGLGGRRGFAPVVGAALVVGAGVHAFVLGPRQLQTNTVRIEVDGLNQPVRVALLSDIQTDHVGHHEARALAAAAAAEPDLVVFTGDYVQLLPGPAFDRETAALAAAIRDSGLSAPLGMYAVRGDVDPPGWPASFADTGVVVFEDSAVVDLGPLTLTALRPVHSRSLAPPVPDVDGPHLVIGHAPDFALAQPDGDVLLAGHVHGGQVALPGIGPLITFSAVPRAWASGHTKLPWGADLVVTRGIGMERQDAPRLRFLCPPEVVIVELVPAADPGDTAGQGAGGIADGHAG